MRLEHLDHLAARFALDCVEQRFGNITNPKDDGFTKYRSSLLSAGTSIRQMGILQTAAFWYSSDGSGPRGLMQDVFKWFATNEVTKWVWQAGQTTPAAGLTFLIARPSVELVLLETEAERIIAFLKRIVEGRKHDLECGGQTPRTEQPHA